MSFVYPGVVPETEPVKNENKPDVTPPPVASEKSATWTEKVAALFTSKDEKK